MANDPRTFTVKDCPKQNKTGANNASAKKGFLDNLTKIGDLEILNDIGFGKVGEGLRVLSSVSDSVRVGSSTVPGREGNETFNSTLGKIANTALDAVDQGAQAVLDATGLGEALNKVSDLSPEVANRAYGQARQIYEKVKQGNFELSDIPGAFQDLQNLEILGRGIFGGQGTKPKELELCGASPYAVDLIAYAPKFNFMFVVDVTFHPEYADWTNIGNTMAFVIKRSMRPRVEFEYEDVNMYNFWTKVPKKVVYPPITMAFYDDNKNATHLFYTAYMRAMSPIANMQKPTNQGYEQNSMNYNRGPDTSSFTAGGPSLAGYSSSLGSLLGASKSIVERIRLYHVFDYGRMMNIYNFHNPRILEFTPSDLTMMETGEGAEFEFQFAYDSLFIEPGWSVQAGGDNKDLKSITNNRGSASYPIDPVFDDLTFTDENSQQSLHVPIAQEQLKNAPETNENMRTTLGQLSASNNTVNNFTSGVVGAFNDQLAQISNQMNQVTQRLQQEYRAVANTVTSVSDKVKDFFS